MVEYRERCWAGLTDSIAGGKASEMRRIKVQWQNREVEGEEVRWEVERGEDWSVYKLSDETTLKVRTFVNKIVRLDERHADGEPIYVVMSQNNVVAHVEPHMMVQS